MSYSIEIVHEVMDVDVGDQTYNTTPMFVEAVGNRLRDFDKQTCDEVAPKLLVGIIKMVHAPDIYRAMNPENGWGSYEDALRYLVDMYKACLEHPNSIVRVY
jgi:hypothetical protein